jgi:hypothetical protein
LTFCQKLKALLKKVWQKGVGFGAGEKDLSSKGLFSRSNFLNLFYRPLSGTEFKKKPPADGPEDFQQFSEKNYLMTLAVHLS